MELAAQRRVHEQAVRDVVPDFLRAMRAAGAPGAVKVRGTVGSVKPKKVTWQAWSLDVASIAHGNGDIGRWTREEELLLATTGEWVLWPEPQLPTRKRVAFPMAPVPTNFAWWAAKARRLGEIAAAHHVALSPESIAALQQAVADSGDRTSRLSSRRRW